MQLNAAEPGVGDPSLMTVIAAVIVGGASMQGGRGSAFKSLVALFTINMVAAGFNRHGAGAEIIDIANGVMLGAIILYEAVQTARQQLAKGQRHELLARLVPLERLPLLVRPSISPSCACEDNWL